MFYVGVEEEQSGTRRKDQKTVTENSVLILYFTPEQFHCWKQTSSLQDVKEDDVGGE